MSFISSYAESLLKMGLEEPSSQEFIEHSDYRTIAAFFLGWTFIACLRYLALATLRHPFTVYLVRAALRRPIIVTIAERRLRASTNGEGHTVQSWLQDTHGSSEKSKPDRPEGTRHLSVVLTGTFTVAVFMQFLSLLDFKSQTQDVLCIIVIAWAGIAVAAAKIACLLRITFDLMRLGTGSFERIASWVILLLSFGASLAHATISIGATRDVPQIPGLSLCYRRHFLPTSMTVSLLNILLELYFVARTFTLLVPQFLQFHHKVEMMMDVRVARVASILCLELLTLLPNSLSINIAAEFIPFSLGTLLVLAAFNHHPSKPAEPSSLPTSHRTSVIAFPTNNGRDDGSMISLEEAEAKPVKLTLDIEAPVQPPARKESLHSEPARKPRSLHKSRQSRASHVSYDSEAEARSVRGAVVSFAFKSGEVEPMPAIPYGIYQPKLVGSPKIVASASQAGFRGSDLSLGAPVRPNVVALPSPLGSSTEMKPLPLPKPPLSTLRLPAVNSRAQLTDTPTPTDSVVYGSDVIRRSNPTASPQLAHRSPGSSLVRHDTTSSLRSVSHVSSQPYTGPDLSHFSMGSQSTTFETRDYLGVSSRSTGPYRTPTLGATTPPQRVKSLASSGLGSMTMSLGSSRGRPGIGG
ncbi:hypothetical protein BDV93DRAFT_603450 [Ceratobasidium sp. AG-I]|nr:hypothetical protein BDV93DRAFT_603450 [Ceratobasidium sp. AG-I]